MTIKYTLLNNNYYKKYTYLFNYSNKLYHIINNYILYNYIFSNKICKYLFKYSFKKQIYEHILFYDKNNIKKYNYNPTLLYDDILYFNEINNNKILNDKKYLIIANTTGIIIRLLNNYKNQSIYKKIDCLLYKNILFTNKDIEDKDKYYKTIQLFNKIYSSHKIVIYKQFLINLKNNNKDNNISIPNYKYDFISCYIGYDYGISLSASYKMTLELPNIISTIAMALKNISKDGTLLLFWSIVNVNIPVIKKILSILKYGFKNIEIIDNDINQNLLIGVPEYYIKCSGYKDNISNDLINKLLDIAIETVEYTYDTCDILDYYEDYTEKHHNHSLFYNKIDENEKHNKLTKKQSSIKKSRKSSTRKSTKSQKNNKPIKPIYYIEDINIPELDEIMKDSQLQFEVSLLMNKLENIFVDYFKMVNNLIVNAIQTDSKGNMFVKPEYILQKDITNLTKLISMFEYNKLPYNKHALKVVLQKQDEIIDHFYSLDAPINQKFIKYEDKRSKSLNKYAITHYKSSKSSKSSKKKNIIDIDIDILNNYYTKIKLAKQVKDKLLEDVDYKTYLKNTPKVVEYATYDFASGLSMYLNNRYKLLPIEIGNSFLKLWEILDTFNLMPYSIESFKVLHLCEAPGQMILCAKYWAENKCPKLNMSKYEWMANTLNPYDNNNKHMYSNIFGKNYDLINPQYNQFALGGDNYNLIKENYDKWLWGADNTGDITNINNIKSIMTTIKESWLKPKGKSTIPKKLDLIISDGSLSLDMNSYYSQKMEFAQLLTVMACSSIGGNCCVKHFIPYKNSNDVSMGSGGIGSGSGGSGSGGSGSGGSGSGSGINMGNNPNTISIYNSSNFFIGYLYMYYVAFDSVSLFKPNTSYPDTREFYVIGKGFKGITDKQLDNLFKILDTFLLNNIIIDIEHIPDTFIKQINNFLESMSNLNVLSIEKQNLLLTCFKTLGENDKEKYESTNKILKCDTFFNKKQIENILIPKYKEWIKIFNFE